MRLGSRLRGEFPRGWWSSARWWITGIRELALSIVAAVTTVVFVGGQERQNPVNALSTGFCLACPAERDVDATSHTWS